MTSQNFNDQNKLDVQEIYKVAGRYGDLSKEAEIALAEKWLNDQDEDAKHQLVKSHFRWAIKITNKYKGFGVPFAELFQEAAVGLSIAADKFDPDKGFRFSTYSMWWIKAQIKDYLLRNKNMVNTGTASDGKMLHFNLRKAVSKAQIELETFDMTDSVWQRTAEILEWERDLNTLKEWGTNILAADMSLNTPVARSGEGAMEWQDWLEDENSDAADIIAEEQETEWRREIMLQAFDVLNEREKDIFIKRRLQETHTLEDLGEIYGLSKERIRQLEEAAFKKLYKEALKITEGLVSKGNPVLDQMKAQGENNFASLLGKKPRVKKGELESAAELKAEKKSGAKPKAKVPEFTV